MSSKNRGYKEIKGKRAQPVLPFGGEGEQETSPKPPKECPRVHGARIGVIQAVAAVGAGLVTPLLWAFESSISPLAKVLVTGSVVLVALLSLQLIRPNGMDQLSRHGWKVAGVAFLFLAMLLCVGIVLSQDRERRPDPAAADPVVVGDVSVRLGPVDQTVYGMLHMAVECESPDQVEDVPMHMVARLTQEEDLIHETTLPIERTDQGLRLSEGLGYGRGTPVPYGQFHLQRHVVVGEEWVEQPACLIECAYVCHFGPECARHLDRGRFWRLRNRTIWTDATANETGDPPHSFKVIQAFPIDQGLRVEAVVKVGDLGVDGDQGGVVLAIDGVLAVVFCDGFAHVISIKIREEQTAPGLVVLENQSNEKTRALDRDIFDYGEEARVGFLLRPVREGYLVEAWVDDRTLTTRFVTDLGELIASSKQVAVRTYDAKVTVSEVRICPGPFLR